MTHFAINTTGSVHNRAFESHAAAEDYAMNHSTSTTTWEAVSSEDQLRRCMTGKALVKIYNAMTGKSLVKFKSKSSAVTRTWAALIEEFEQRANDKREEQDDRDIDKELEQPVEKKTRGRKPGSGLKHLLYADFMDGAHYAVDEIVERYGCTKSSAQTAISDLRNAKYSGYNMAVPLAKDDDKKWCLPR